MKKVFKSLLYLSVGLTFILSSCSKDKDKDSDNLAGTFNVLVFLNHNPTSVKATLTVTQDGDNLKTSGSVTLDQLGKVDLNLVLSSLTVDSGSGKENGISYSYTDAYFLIAKQKVTVGSKGSFDFQGAGYWEGFDDKDYDGGIYIASGGGISYKELYFDIQGDVTGVGSVTISVEPDFEDMD